MTWGGYENNFLNIFYQISGVVPNVLVPGIDAVAGGRAAANEVKVVFEAGNERRIDDESAIFVDVS